MYYGDEITGTPLPPPLPFYIHTTHNHHHTAIHMQKSYALLLRY